MREGVGGGGEGERDVLESKNRGVSRCYYFILFSNASF